MLMLTRKPGEALVLETANGEKAKVVIIENRGAQVRLGVIADKSISVDREEIHLRKMKEAGHG